MGQQQSQESAANSSLLFALDDMRSKLERAIREQSEHDLMVQAAAQLTGITFSAGYLAWLLRAGPMLAGLATSIPMWARFDPLPVMLAGSRNKKEHVADSSGEDNDQEIAAGKILGAQSLAEETANDLESVQ